MPTGVGFAGSTCFIDNEIVGPNPGIDDLTSVPFPCYNVRVSNAHRRGVCRFNPSVKPR